MKVVGWAAGVGMALLLEVGTTSFLSVVEGLCRRSVVVVVLVGDDLSVVVVLVGVGREGLECDEVECERMFGCMFGSRVGEAGGRERWGVAVCWISGTEVGMTGDSVGK